MIKWSDLIKEKPITKECKVTGEDVAFYIYTSGTTSRPKGVILKHSNIIANVKQIHNHWNLVKEANEVILGPLPLYHSFALMCQMWYPMFFGGNVILVTNPRHIKSVVKSYRRNKCTIIIGIETLFRALLHNKSFCKYTSFSNLKITISGGAATDPTVLQKWYKVTRNHMITGYGITEASPIVATHYIDQIHYRDMTVGLPIPSTQVKIIDDDGNELPNGESGELIIKGPQVSCGYLNKPEETAQNFKNGWLYTGDIAQLSDDGFVTIVGRKKEMLNISGFCVSPYEIEEVYNKHPKISESVAVQIKTPKGGDTIKLVVIPKDKSVTKEELLDYGKRFLTNYKCPHVIEFVEEIPKSNVGKVLRRLIK
jgi:long-chain acyl-CoA synthetase